MAAMNSAEERKVDFIASLMAALVFRSDIDVATSHLLLYLAEQTTYRGLVLLRIISENEPGRFVSRGSGDVMPFSEELTPLAVEVAELINRGLVSMRDAPEAQDSYLFSGHEMVDPSLLYLTAVGRMLYDLTDLKDMSTESVTYSETFEELQRLSQAAPRTTVIDGGKA